MYRSAKRGFNPVYTASVFVWTGISDGFPPVKKCCLNLLIYTYHSTRRLFAVTRVYLQFNAARLFLFCSGLRLT